jgi:hypothetical protein
VNKEIKNVNKEIKKVNRRITDLEKVIGWIPRGLTTVPEAIVDTQRNDAVLLLCNFKKDSLLDQLADAKKTLTNLQDQLSSKEKRLTSAALLRDKLSTGLTTSSAAVSSNAAAVLDVNDLLSVEDVVEPQVAASNPPFLTKGWIKKRVNEIYAEFVRKDHPAGLYRKPPMAVVRCSRGGKSRALIELALRIKSRCDITAFRICFNDLTALTDVEQDDLIGAVCRRIAFAARKDTNITFAQFLKFSVTEKLIEAWLGDKPLVLLLDEINLAREIHAEGSKVGKDFAIFLKEHFF